MKAIMTLIGAVAALCVTIGGVNSGALIQDSRPGRNSELDVTKLRESFERSLGFSLDEKTERSRNSEFDVTKLRASFERSLGFSLDEKTDPDAVHLEYVDSGSQGSETARMYSGVDWSSGYPETATIR